MGGAVEDIVQAGGRFGQGHHLGYDFEKAARKCAELGEDVRSDS